MVKLINPAYHPFKIRYNFTRAAFGIQENVVEALKTGKDIIWFIISQHK